MTTIEITASAEDYLAKLLSKQEVEGIAVRLFVTDPGTPNAETCLSYYRPDEVQISDKLMQLEQFRVYIETNSVSYLKAAVIDYAADKMGGQLTIKSPNSKIPQVNEDSPIEAQINYYLYTEVNPGLASHGGQVSLVEVVNKADNVIAVLRFGGGCQGCSAVDLTLKDGVEKILMEKIPDLAGVYDVTDHSNTTNAYM